MEMIAGRFGRENTVLKEGKYIKDLSYLNRPIREVVYVDYSDEPVQFHRENAVLIPKFDGDKSDRELIDLMPFLIRKSLLISLDLAKTPNDVRAEIRKFGGSDKCAREFHTLQMNKLQEIKD
jgi:hypothetical protein